MERRKKPGAGKKYSRKKGHVDRKKNKKKRRRKGKRDRIYYSTMRIEIIETDIYI